MAYIVINGKSSKEVTGLLIQSLPPITKPKIRTSIEEIDGRDGDIVNTLGYSAYDKTISVGLRGDYNVDDVINFFNTSGKITFSNEVDKYYNFAIYDTANFNKLIRFKTADINIHCQPFKYSVDEPSITWKGSDTIAEIGVRNNGNIYSKPKITIKGAGDCFVYIKSELILTLQLSPNGETIIIDVEKMNATDPVGNYLNRRVTGDYNKLVFQPGHNNLVVMGELESVTVENITRWV